ncbi:acyltransferase domain-containing protein, partial [Actibacterium sp.]|uniref:acyltransferase domain-containing protein n=1 Tax=Actibacterium sp. TaxID=1872125 RepID=UPI00356AAC31
AGVNAFGFGGINTHAILEEAPQIGAGPSSATWPCELIVMSADTPQALAAKADALRATLAERPEILVSEVAAALAAEAGTGASRLALTADSLADLDSKLGKASERLSKGRGKFQMRSGIFASDERIDGKMAFVFPGEGAQYQGMLGDVLIAFPEARNWFDFWDGIYGDSRPIAPSTCVFPPPSTLSPEMSERLEKALFGLEVGSESVFVASQSLLAVTERLGLRPDAMVGHSSGEHSALRAAGVIGGDDWDGLKARILDLNRLYQQMEEVGAVAAGALLTVGAIDRTRILEIAEADDIHLALDNCHHQSVLYGTRARMEEIATLLRAEGGLCAFLPFDRPYHTSLFAPVAKMVEGVYASMEFHPPKLPLYSCATAQPMPQDVAEIQRLAAEQWQSRVRFTETVQAMYDDGVRLFVEIGPSANLTGFIEDVLKGTDAQALPLDSRRRPSLQTLLQTMGRLWLAGRDVALAALFQDRDITPTDLATPAKPSRARVFDNTLQLVRLTEDEVAPLRARFDALRPEITVPMDQPEAEPVLTEHFALMQQFLGMQEHVLSSSFGDMHQIEPEAPLHFLHRVLELDENHLIAECDVDLETDQFLRDHVLYCTEVSDLDPSRVGLPVVPLAVSMEMLAEAAAALAPDLTVLRLEQVRTYDWVLVEDGFDTLTIEATRLTTGSEEARFNARVRRGESTLMEANVVLGTAQPDAGFTLPPLQAPLAPVWRDEDLYTTGMFHGPLFHAISSLSAWDQGGLDAVMADTPLDDFSPDMPNATLILNPALLDAVGHITAFWIAQGMGTDFSSFPSSIERIDLFDARREDTAGFRIGGRVAFEGGTDGPRYLCGDFTCATPDGAPVLAVRGWRDRFFEVPHSFYHARYKPRDGWYGQDQSALFAVLPEAGLVWSVPAFPAGFLNDAGGIWRRVLTHTVLTPDERAAFLALPPRAARREDWLVGRIALKEATRAWIDRHYGLLLLPADIEIGVTPDGKPFATGAGLSALGPMPELSLTHTGGQALAVAAAPGVSVGIDMERVGRISTPDLMAGAFSDAEQAIALAGEATDERAMRVWCAKEAAAKMIGVGLTARPRRFALRTLDVAGNQAIVDAPEQQNIHVSQCRDGDMILAVAFAGT